MRIDDQLRSKIYAAQAFIHNILNVGQLEENPQWGGEEGNACLSKKLSFQLAGTVFREGPF